MAEHHSVGHDRERSSRESPGGLSVRKHEDSRHKTSSHGGEAAGGGHGGDRTHKRSTRNWKNITTHVQVVERMKKTSISNNRDHQSRDRQLASDGGVDAADVARNSGREKSSGSKNRQSSIRFSEQSDSSQNPKSKSRHSDHAASRSHPDSAAYEGYYQPKPSKVSLSSALDEIMMDMSSSSTIVECYCGQNDCPHCNLLLKMAGSDG